MGTRAPWPLAAEVLADNGDVPRRVAHDPLRLDDKRGLLDHHKAQPVLGDEQTLALVVEAALLAAAHAGYGLASVEEWRGLGMLLLLELDDELESGPEAVHRELCAERSRKGRIAAEPVERRLAAAARTKNLVAHFENVVLVGCSAVGHAAILAETNCEAHDSTVQKTVVYRTLNG